MRIGRYHTNVHLFFVKIHTLIAGCSETRMLLTKNLHSTTNDIKLECFSLSWEAKLGIKLSFPLDLNTMRQWTLKKNWKKSLTGNEKSTAVYLLLSNSFLGNQKVAILKADFVYCVAILRKRNQQLSLKQLLLAHIITPTSSKNLTWKDFSGTISLVLPVKIKYSVMKNISKRKETGVYNN